MSAGARRCALVVGLVVAALLLWPVPSAKAREPGDIIFNAGFFEQGSNWQTPSGHGCVRYVDGYVELCLKRNAAGDLVMGRIDTEGKWSFIYGRVTARMRFIGPKGAHGCGWITTTEDYIPGQAEIDYAENFGPNVIHHTVWWREPGQKIGEFTKATDSTPVADVGEWHTYEVNWRPDRYTFRVDDQVESNIYQGLSDRPKMLVLSMLVADWERDDLQWGNLGAYKVQVDWLRVEANPWTR